MIVAVSPNCKHKNKWKRIFFGFSKRLPFHVAACGAVVRAIQHNILCARTWAVLRIGDKSDRKNRFRASELGRIGALVSRRAGLGALSEESWVAPPDFPLAGLVSRPSRSPLVFLPRPSGPHS